MFVTAGVELKFHNWPVESSDELIYKQQGSGNIDSISWSKENTFLTFVPEKGNPEIISLKDPNNIKNVHTITAIPDTTSIAFQRTTKRGIGLGTNTGQIALYDTKNKLISRLFASAPCAVNLLDFSSADKQMAASCVNGTVLLYDVKHGDVRESYTASSTYSPTAMRYHPTDKHVLAIATADGNIMQWDTNAGLTKFCAQIHTAPVTGLVILQNSDLMVSVGYDHKFCIHDLNRECVFRSNHQFPLTAVDVSHDSLTVAVGSVAGILYIYDIRKLMQPLTSWQAHEGRINKILFEHKVKYEIDSMEDLAVNCTKNHEITVKSETKFMKRNERKTDVKTFYEGKCSSEKEFKYLSDKSSNDKKCPSETITLKSIKQEVADSIHRGANELRNHLMTQFGSLHNFILNEFQTIDNQMEEKWDLVNVAKYVPREAYDKDPLE